jgi:hypothetical protein
VSFAFLIIDRNGYVSRTVPLVPVNAPFLSMIATCTSSPVCTPVVLLVKNDDVPGTASYSALKSQASNAVVFAGQMSICKLLPRAPGNLATQVWLPGSNAFDAAESTSKLPAPSLFVKNKDHFDAQQSALADLTKTALLKTDSDGAGNLLVDSAASNALDPGNHTWVARFPGALGNSLQIDICPANTTAFDAWDFKAEYDAVPGTSSFLTNNTTGVQTGDEVHVAIIDKNGAFTGTKGTVLETYPFLSIIKNAKDTQGSSIYAKDVINERSEYAYWVNWGSDY